MTSKTKSILPILSFIILAGLQLAGNTVFAQGPGPGQRPSLPPIPIKGDTTHTLTTHLTSASSIPKAPDAKGFIQRWLVLEPVKKNIARNNIFTDNYLKTNFLADNFSADYSIIPQKGETVKVGNEEL